MALRPRKCREIRSSSTSLWIRCNLTEPNGWKNVEAVAKLILDCRYSRDAMDCFIEGDKCYLDSNLANPKELVK